MVIVSGRYRIRVCEASLQGKVRHFVRQFVRRAACRQQLQIFDKLADADSLLASEDHARERDFGFLLLLSDPQQVGVLREQRSPQLRRSGEQGVVVERASFVFLTGQDVEATAAQAKRHGRWHMHVHVKRERHGRHPALRRNSSARDRVCRLRAAATSSAVAVIAATSSSW